MFAVTSLLVEQKVGNTVAAVLRGCHIQVVFVMAYQKFAYPFGFGEVAPVTSCGARKSSDSLVDVRNLQVGSESVLPAFMPFSSRWWQAAQPRIIVNGYVRKDRVHHVFLNANRASDCSICIHLELASRKVNLMGKVCIDNQIAAVLLNVDDLQNFSEMHVLKN